MATIFNHSYKADDKFSAIDYLFYLATILLATVVFIYLIFGFKVYLQTQRIEQIEEKLIKLNSKENQVRDKMAADYKKQIDDFAKIVSQHRITSNLFDFLEGKTLPGVWFSSFNAQGSENEVNLSGEAKDEKTLSRQVEIFEKSPDSILSVNVLNSQNNLSGKASFTLNLILNPKVFLYKTANLTMPLYPLENSSTAQ